MKSYQIRINDLIYQVEIADLTTRPIRAVVNGEWFEVWPDAEKNSKPSTLDTPFMPGELSNPVPIGAAPRTSTISSPSRNGVPLSNGRLVKSPLPGVVIAIHVQIGEEIAAGQPLCVVEAMKMNNVVRASEPGKITALQVSIGQHVKHQDILMEYK